MQTEITERKLAEEQIASLAKFAEENPAPVLRVSTDGKIIYVNPAARPIMDEWQSQDGGNLPEPIREALQHVVDSKVWKQIEFEHRDLTIALSMVPVLENGYVNLYGSDITDRKRAEDQLRQVREREALHVMQTPLGVIEWNLNFEVTAWNPGAERIFGYSKKQAMGKHASFIVPESVKAHVDTVWEQLLQHTGGTRSTNDNVRKDGRTIQIEWFNTPLVDAQGDAIAVASLVQDVTEERQTQVALEATNRRLEEALAELRSTQDQLVQQERLNALGTMASGVAHDFNNALSPILGYCDILLTYPKVLDDKSQTAEYIRTISTAAKDAAAVVDRLREFYRHREDAELFQVVDLNQLVIDAISLSQPRWQAMAQAAGSHIELQTDLTPDLPLVAGNQSDLRTVLTNLIFNAVDAMPNGGTLTISTRMSGERVQLGVSDTGVGMTDQVRSRAFELFFTTKGDSGTGLGLAMVFGIVNRHGGEIDLESEVGKGSSFSIRLPMQKETPVVAKQLEIERVSRSLHILLADDDPAVRKLLGDYLSRDGHTIESVADGQAALTKFQEGEFDLVITDRGCTSSKQVGQKGSL